MKKNTRTIIEVYEKNFISEVLKLSRLIEKYNIVAMDTEFPGIVYQLNNYTTDTNYKTIKMNVDELKLIQLGITISDKFGNYPREGSTWQFNLKFDIDTEKYSYDSIALLNSSGIDFRKLGEEGIPYDIFAEYFMTSGLVLNENIQWISFHGSYDFAYLLKLASGQFLPENEKCFFENLEMYFNNFYDIRFLTMNHYIKGSLNKIAQDLEIERIGISHQAGSDSIVTSEVFFTLIKRNLLNNINLHKGRNKLFGFDDEFETEQFSLISNTQGHKINTNYLNNGKNTNKENYIYNNLGYTNNSYNVLQYSTNQNSSVNVLYPYLNTNNIKQNQFHNNYTLKIANFQQLYNLNKNTSKMVDVNSSGNINSNNSNSGYANYMNNNIFGKEKREKYEKILPEAYSN